MKDTIEDRAQKLAVYDTYLPIKKTRANAIETAPTSPAKHLAFFLKLKK